MERKLRPKVLAAIPPGRTHILSPTLRRRRRFSQEACTKVYFKSHQSCGDALVLDDADPGWQPRAIAHPGLLVGYIRDLVTAAN